MGVTNTRGRRRIKVKITVEELDNAIKKQLNNSLQTKFQRAIKNGQICRDSIEFRNILDSYARIFNSVINSELKDLIFNCLLTGIEIGYIIAENLIEVKQLEVMCGITEGEDNDRSG